MLERGEGAMRNSTRRSVGFGAIAAAALLVAACGQRGEARQNNVALDPPSPASPNPPASTAVDATPVATTGSTPAEERDPDAIKALEHMGAYLQTLTTFQIRSE